MKQDSEDKLARVLEALENPSSFTKEELDSLFADEECVQNARAILSAREALARQQVSQPDINKEWNAFERRHRKTSVIPWSIGLVAAACIALLFILHNPTAEDKGLQVFEAIQAAHTVRQETINGVMTIEVPRGMQKQITLPDGTVVTLNAESSLSYAVSSFGKDIRMVTLQGEGLFDVAKDSLHPFIVRSDGLSARVLGTVFNVRNYATEKMKITLLSGSLKVVSAQRADSLLIRPGEQAVLTDKHELRTVRTTQTADITAWSEGSFYFDNQTLVEILCELGRWYNVNVVFRDKECMNSRLHFKAFRNESLASIIELLNYVSKNPVVLEDKTIIVGK